MGHLCLSCHKPIFESCNFFGFLINFHNFDQLCHFFTCIFSTPENTKKKYFVLASKILSFDNKENTENNSYFSQFDFRLLIIFLYMPCNLNSNWDVFNNKWNICPCLLFVSFNTMSRSCLHLLFCSPIGVRFVVWSISHRRVTLQSRIMLRTLTLLSITFSGVRAPSCSNFWVSGNSFCNGKALFAKYISKIGNWNTFLVT